MKLINNEKDDNINSLKTKVKKDKVKVINKKIYKYNKKLINNYISLKKKDLYEKIFSNKQSWNLIKLIIRKIPSENKYIHRLARELQLIDYFNFTEVFLQVSEILKLAGKIPHIIRGSSGSCLLCYLMRITDIDPIKEKICLSRFMHKDRASIPDIDIDFPHKFRDEIYSKVFSKWENRVARISNHIMYKERSAIREAIREQGYRKMVRRDFDLNDIFDDKETVKKVIKRSKELINNFRCYSLHCGGIIIFKNKVPDNLVLKDFEIKKGKVGKQIWMNKDQVEEADMIKIDLLSNRGISQLWDISKKPIDEYPYDDKKTMKVLSSGKNLGLTQAESRGMRKILKTMKPKNIEDLATALALIRPAASKNYQKSAFLRDYNRFTDKRNRDKFIIFDDDATLYIKSILNCDEADADNFRRAFSKNKKEGKAKFEKIIRNQSYSKREVDNIMEQLNQLAYYSFCKSHAYSYAKMVWALAYNKVYKPKEFWLSTLNNCNSSYKKWVHFREAKKAGLKLSLGKKPWYLVDNELRSEKSIYPLFNNSYEQLSKYGYWISDDFLPGMNYQEYWTKLTKRHTKAMVEKFNIIDFENNKIMYAKFKGLVATGRVHKKENGKGFITFLTVGYDDGKYIDLVIYGVHKVSKIFTISGYGKVKFDGYCKYIDVIKYNY